MIVIIFCASLPSKAYMPVHRIFGYLTYVLGALAVQLGLASYAVHVTLEYQYQK
jgi:hypothetical protein